MSLPPESCAPAEVEPGHLYVVATPLGNLGDLSPRAVAVLRAVTRIAAEDTRTSGVLLARFDIRTPTVALHEHNQARAVPDLIRQLQAGESLALISDAGTPLVSDPGFPLLRAARAAGIEVRTVPGPCAAIAALSVAGLPSDEFLFAGFLPPKAAARRRRLQQLAAEPRSVIAYESSHRIAACLDDVAAVFDRRAVLLARELTKRFEQSVLFPAHALPGWLAQDANRQRGEFVLVFEGATPADENLAEAERLLRALLGELPAARAARVVAGLTGLRKQAVYELALRLAGEAEAGPSA